jgi:hypothetical protein
MASPLVVIRTTSSWTSMPDSIKGLTYARILQSGKTNRISEVREA